MSAAPAALPQTGANWLAVVGSALSGLFLLAAGFVLSDLLTNLERVADHCSNIAGCLLDMKNERIDLHKYLGDVKSGSNEFLMQYNTFEEKYKLA